MSVQAAGGTAVRVLDPRYDPEPEYWPRLRELAGLRADWSWPVLVAQAWCARTPQPVTVWLADGEPTGVVWGAWVTSRSRRHRFVGDRRAGRIGFLDLRSPNCSALPGWWFSDYRTGDPPDRLADGFADYLRVMRADRGVGLRGLLIRQLAEPEFPAVPGRFRAIRPTEPIGTLVTAGFDSQHDWLAALPRKRRGELRKIDRRVRSDLAIEVGVRRGCEDDPLAVAELLRFNEVKHRDVPIVPLPQTGGYLTRLFAEPDVGTVSYLEPGTGRRLAVAVVLDHPRWPVVRSWSAVPLELGGVRDLYLHVYLELVRWAIETGKQGIVLGKKMAKMKASLGAELTEQYAAAVLVR